jgi:LacI family transcriptional regulator
VWMLTAPSRAGGFEVFDKRETGYRTAMAGAGLADRTFVVESRSHTGEDEQELLALIDRVPRPGGVFCWSDIHAVPLLTLARARGVKVPHEMAVVGYDNSRVAALAPIGLTSIDQHGHDIGSRAARTLLRRIRGAKAGEHLLITPEIIRRSSSSC